MASRVGKFLIYAPATPDRRKRLSVVSKAASRVAEKTGLKIEISKTDRVSSPYIFYLNRDVEDVPIYCDLGKDWDEERICNSIWSIIYALSFLPEFSILQSVRRS